MNNIMSTKVQIFRNLKEYKFSNKLSEDSKNEIIEKVKLAVKGKMELVNLNEIDDKTMQFMTRSNSQVSNLLFAHKAKDLAIEMFGCEHMAIIAKSNNGDDSAYELALKTAQELSNKINFAFNDEYGYLMSDLNHIGTGIQIESEIMLLSIKAINKIEQVKQNVMKLGYHLQETKFKGMFKLKTKCNLGLSEKQVVSDFKNTLLKLQELEIESAKVLDAEKHDELLDKSNRSKAVLESAHLLDYEELYSIVANLRIGQMLSMNNISDITLNELQKLVINKKDEFISQSEQKELAQKVKEILKGEKNV